MATITYKAVGTLPEGVPAAVIDCGVDGCLILVDETLTAGQVCEALTPLITRYAGERGTWQYLPETA